MTRFDRTYHVLLRPYSITLSARRQVRTSLRPDSGVEFGFCGSVVTIYVSCTVSEILPLLQCTWMLVTLRSPSALTRELNLHDTHVFWLVCEHIPFSTCNISRGCLASSIRKTWLWSQHLKNGSRDPDHAHPKANTWCVAYLCTEFDHSIFSRSRDMSGALKSKIGHMILTMPTTRLVCHQ